MRSKTGKILRVLFLLFLLAMVSVAALLPRLLPGRDELARLSAPVLTEYAMTMQIGNLEWNWLPYPHLAVTGSTLTGNGFMARLPEVHLYPDWLALLKKKRVLRRLELVSPVITGGIAPLPLRLPAAVTGQLPSSFSLSIQDGRVSVVRPWVVNGSLESNPFTVAGIAAEIDLTGSRLEIRLASAPDFAEKLRLAGSVDLANGSYGLDFDLAGLRLHEWFSSFAGGRVVPLDSRTGLKGRASATAAGRQTISLHGDLPGFMLEPIPGKKRPLTGGTVDLVIELDRDRLTAQINGLELKDPALRLEGSVAMTRREDGAEPVWDLDLRGHDLDLTGIREAVLDLWGEHHLATTVTGIVMGGRAAAASYRFSGPVADFSDLRAMTITVDVEDSRIVVPAVNLDLSEARGPIRIADGRLSGEGLSARLGNSLGTDCRLLVGLTEDDHAFQLDIDLAADLAELPGVLAGIIRDSRFKRELSLVGKTSGSARGKLIIGDTLNDFDVLVKVSSMQGQGEYRRINQALKVEAGELSIAPQLVEWKGLQGKIGPHAVLGVSGRVDWHAPEAVKAALAMEGASVDAKALHELLTGYEQLTAPLTRVVSAIEGEVRLAGLIVSGKPEEPDSWRYQFDASTAGLEFMSPLLDSPARAAKASARITDAAVSNLTAELSVFGRPLTINGDLFHTGLQNWHGNLVFNGTVEHDFAGWIENHGWIPAAWFPRIPCRAENLRVNWGGGITALTGNVVAVKDNLPASPPAAFLDLTANHGILTSFHGVFIADGEQGTLSFTGPEADGTGFSFRWDGLISGRTASALLRRQQILSGFVNGAFRIDGAADGPGKFAIAGMIAADGLSLLTNSGEPLTVNNVYLSGDNERLVVHELDFDAISGEPLSVAGELSLLGQGIQVELTASGEKLSSAGLDRLLRMARRQDRSKEEKDILDTVIGSLAFHLDRFEYSPRKATGEAKPPLIWAPLAGRLLLHPHGRMIAHIDRASLCCLETAGIWEMAPDKNQASLQLKSACPEKGDPLFQEVMPCLGIKQNLIVGEFDLQAELTGLPSHWESGKITLRSPRGRILRMGLLSKIFKVVNVTDLFTSEEIPDLDSRGFPYSDLVVEASIKDNILLLEQCVVRGEGLNIFGNGTLDLGPREADLTFLIAPLKTIDAIASKVPLLGRVIGGKNATVVTIPVGVTGPVENPTVSLLPPEAIGEGVLNLVKDALLLPFYILSPILPKEQ